MSFRLGDFRSQIDPKLLQKKGPRMRNDGRADDELRPVVITPGFNKHAEGSALIEVGDTRVLCTVSVEERLPQFLKGKGEGWITAEYGMLPRSTTTRSQREASRGRPSGRTYEIQRLIGRSMRAVIDMAKLGERTLWLDCDVIQADGGTRTASITGGFVALVLALQHLKKKKAFKELPLTAFVAATSVGKIGGEIKLDLDYSEDSAAEVDMNVVKTGSGDFIEIQGTAEDSPFTEKEMHGLLEAADKGIKALVEKQREVLGDIELLKPKS